MLFLIFACAAAPTNTRDIVAESCPTVITESLPPVESEPPPCDLFTWYEDCDGDGFGYFPEGEYPPIACEGQQPPVTDPSRCVWRKDAGDCDDGEPEVHPVNGELCDGRDNDCDSYADETC